MATIADIIGKSAREALESTVKNTNKVIKEVTQEASEKKSRFVRDNLDKDWVPDEPKKLNRNSEHSGKRYRRKEDVDIEEKIIDQGNKFNDNRQREIDAKIELDRQAERQANIDAEKAGFNNYEELLAERKRQQELGNNIGTERINTEVNTYRQGGTTQEIDVNTNTIQEPKTMANQYTSQFNSADYDDYAARNKVDEATMVQREKTSELKAELKEKHGAKIDEVMDAKNKQKNKKVEESRKYFTNDNIKKTVGLGIGGAMVFSMFDKGGQLSNAELYGQQQPYGY